MIITQTPLRMSFFGGGTDYPDYFVEHGGAVLGTAINKSAFFSVSRFYGEMFDYSVRIAYSKVELVDDIDDLQHAPFRECLRWGGVTENTEINLTTELPAHTGLGSSSTFVVGLLNSLNAYKGDMIPPIELAYQAIYLERHILHESVGCQDQMFAALGGFNFIEFVTEDNIIVNRLSLSRTRLQELEDSLLIFFTGIKRKAEGLASQQVKRVAHNLAHLKKMRKMVDKGASILLNSGSLTEFGELLHEAWLCKQQLASSITNPTIDRIYQDGREAGALGGKLLGAGAGGFIVFCVPPEKQSAVRNKLSYLNEISFRLNEPGSRIIHAQWQQ